MRWREISSMSASSLGSYTNRQHDTTMNEQTIYLAGGCFWGTQHFVGLLPGVLSTEVGYANGNGSPVTYAEVCTDTTGYAETVCVRYDADTIALERILELFYKTIDPTSLNRQGGDHGSQYRTGIYYTREADLPIIEESLRQLATLYRAPIVIECLPLENYFAAEEYHQDYLDKNPGGYCHIRPELFLLARKG